MATDSVYSLDYLDAFEGCEQGTISIQQLAWVIAEKLEELRSWASVMGETHDAENFFRLHDQFAFVAGTTLRLRMSWTHVWPSCMTSRTQTYSMRMEIESPTRYSVVSKVTRSGRFSARFHLLKIFKTSDFLLKSMLFQERQEEYFVCIYEGENLFGKVSRVS